MMSAHQRSLVVGKQLASDFGSRGSTSAFSAFWALTSARTAAAHAPGVARNHGFGGDRAPASCNGSRFGGPSPRRASITMVPQPAAHRRPRDHTHFAQKPSIAPACNALAAPTPKFLIAPSPKNSIGTGTIFTLSRASSMPDSTSSRLRPRSTSGAAPIFSPLDRVDVALLRLEVGAQDQEPVGVLRQCREELAALPAGKRERCRVRRAADEIDAAVAQDFERPVDRVDQLRASYRALRP